MDRLIKENKAICEPSLTCPHKEVSQEYVNALSTMNWHGVTASDIQKTANA